MIDLQTKLVGLIGKPLEHSLSPWMHNETYTRLGLNMAYLPIEVLENDLETVINGIRKMNFIGFNVTIPHKISIIPYLDDIDPLAKQIGSVNTITCCNGFLKGYNTDGEGFVSYLETSQGINCSDKVFLIMGSGGASRAIAMTLAARKAKKIYLFNRTIEKAKQLASEIMSYYDCICQAKNLDDTTLKALIKEADVLINTTSVGLYPNIDQTPVKYDLLSSHLIVADIIYNPLHTRLLQEAKEKGCGIVTGEGMFVNQGAKAFAIWTKQPAPYSMMKRVLEEKLI